MCVSVCVCVCVLCASHACCVMSRACTWMPVQRRPGVYSRISIIRDHLGESKIRVKIMLSNWYTIRHA